MPRAPHMVPRMAGIELRVSRPSNWSQCRQRGDSVIVGELVMLDLAASDSLTADYTTTNGKTSLGSRSTASTPLGTVIPATDALAHGRVGVAMGATADNALGLYEFGETGDGSQCDVIVRALVLSATANAAGVALEVDVSSSIGRFTLKSAGATFATLLEDTGNTGANVLAWVVLHTGGKGGGGSGGGAEVPAGDEGDVIVLASGGASFEAVTISSILPVSLDDPGTLRGVPTDAGVPAAEAALTTAQVSTLVTAAIASGGVTLAKMANLAAGTTIGRASGAGTGAPTALTTAQQLENSGLAGASEGTIYGRPTGGAQGHNTVASYLPDLRTGTTVQLTLSMSNIEVGSKAFYLIPENLTITQVDVIADVSGSLVLDLWSDTGVPTVADTITASAKPTLSAAQTDTDSTLTGWTTSLVSGEYLVVNVDSVTTITGCTLTITCAVA